MSQSRIAVSIGVTQPAVKQYLDVEERFYFEKLLELGLTPEEVNKFLDSLTEILLGNDIKASMDYVTSFGLMNLSRLKFCKFHRSMDPRIPQECSICEDLFKEDEEEEMYVALSMIQNEIISPLIPEVMSNLAFAKRGAKDINDVIAVAGRITKIRGIPTPASKALWGSSKHLAQILISIGKICPEIRSVMNIKYDEKVMVSMKDIGFKIAVVGPTDLATNDRIAELVSSAYSQGIDAVVHLGGKGVEPNTYIFGKTPIEVVKKVLEIARKYRESNN
ncbi:transcriptional regulator [Acidianus sp. DSM 29099]|nr:thiamine-phosphate synthase family protein [Acidianus sp. RZ1]NON62057.1 transcriptional regulator [Acidianus sp. RZ1]